MGFSVLEGLGSPNPKTPKPQKPGKVWHHHAEAAGKYLGSAGDQGSTGAFCSMNLEGLGLVGRASKGLGFRI